MVDVLWLGVAYVLGSVPFGLLVARNACGVDPRQAGSGNIGATNVARLCGAGYGVAVLLLDAFKGLLAVLVAQALSHSAVYLTLVALAALTGHMYSMFLSGRGGKGVATACGIYLALSPGLFLLAALLTVLVIWRRGSVSLGSLTLAAAMPLLLFFTGLFSLVPLTLIMAGMIYSKHRENILRLAAGQESSWRKKS